MPGSETATRLVRIGGPYIELNKLLKREGLAATGGEAKMLIGAGLVAVNGDAEARIRRKIVRGDRVGCSGVELVISDE